VYSPRACCCCAVVFIATTCGLQVPRWYPLSIVTGGTTAKVMVAAMGNEWGKKFYQGTLTRNIAGVIYKDERAVKQAALKQYPVLKAATGFEYGYKIMDTKNPKAALFGSDVIQVRSVSVSPFLSGRNTKGKIVFSCHSD
jgi:hypothetical protein